MIYTYRTGELKVRFALHMILLLSAAIFFLFFPPGPWGLLFLIVLAIIALLALSPAFTHHSLTKDWLVIRHGIGVKIEIPLKNIKSCEPYEGGLRKLRTGVYSPWKTGTAYILSNREGAVVVGLIEPLTIPAILWKTVDSVVFDVEQRDLFLKNLMDAVDCRGSAF